MEGRKENNGKKRDRHTHARTCRCRNRRNGTAPCQPAHTNRASRTAPQRAGAGPAGGGRAGASAAHGAGARAAAAWAGGGGRGGGSGGGRWRGRLAAGGSRETRERQPRWIEKGERKIRLRRGLNKKLFF
jgi:hypothetical protein